MSGDVLDRYEIVVGLEVHCELATVTKLFCSCPNRFGEEPNTNVCPVCLGLPGSLPVLNEQAVRLAVAIGRALNCRVQPSWFHRKNYFYPDIPKDFQISQYDVPINTTGFLDLPDGSRVGIVRAHIEEDTGKTTHVGGGGGRIHGAEYSLVDYNRSGVPLVEIVSEPDMRGAEQARAYVSELRAILVATGASDGRMEEGSLRVDANVSVRPRGATMLGTRCEIKNLNSLRSLGRAIEYEAGRQAELVEAGGTVRQETRHWSEERGETSPLRSKEQADDYRYFPEPDLPELAPSAELVEAITAALPMLPAERRARLFALTGKGASDDTTAQQVATLLELGLDDLVTAAIEHGAEARTALARAANEGAHDPAGARALGAERFAALVGLETSGALSATQSKAVLAELLQTPEDPKAVAARLGFEQMASDELEATLDRIVAANPGEWERYVAGEDKVAQFLLGKVMAETKGRANGRAVAESLGLRRAAAQAGSAGGS